jgi:nucleotide-binding universal stress UspA family protein
MRQGIAMIEMNRILCPIDFSPFSERALAYAMKLAVWYGARLHVMHVMPLLSNNERTPASLTLTGRNFRAFIERCRLPGADVSAGLVESADPAKRILEAADAFDVDLIVTGSHGRTGYQHALLGSVVETLLRRSARPVLAIPSHFGARPTAEITFSRIMCAVDFDKPSLNALAHASSLAEEAGATLTVLHVIEKPLELSANALSPGFDITAIRANAEAKCLQTLQVLIPEHARDHCRVETAVLEGGASRQILRLAGEQQVDLIVLGSHNRNVFDLAIFGSDAKDVIGQAHCPVLIVPTARYRRSLRSLKAAS